MKSFLMTIETAAPPGRTRRRVLSSLLALLLAGACAAQAAAGTGQGVSGPAGEYARGQAATPQVLIRSVIYFVNRFAAQVVIELDEIVRYQVSRSADGQTIDVDLFGARPGPAIGAQSIPAGDRFVGDVRVVQTGPVTRISIELKTAVFPEVAVEPRPARLILRWDPLAPARPPLGDEPDHPSDTIPAGAVVPRSGRTVVEDLLTRRTSPAAPEPARPAAEAVPAAPAAEPTGVHGPVAQVQAIRLATDIQIDGRLDEESWSLIAPVTEFRQRDPAEGEPGTEPTELRVMYDRAALYVGLRLHDREPERIMRRLSRRDSSPDADYVTVYLDPYHDHLTGVMFQVSAAGAQRDAQIYSDTSTDSTWDAVWFSAVSVDGEGWTAEIKIPFSQLRFNASPNQTWGINVARYIHRKAEIAWLELVPKNASWLASRMAHLTGLDGIEPGQRMELVPYSVARADFLAADPGDPFNDGSAMRSSAGFDLKWGLGSSLTLDATVNPDFGQVEVDPSVVNLTAFETFFEEKRPFFLEGARIFRTITDSSLFYSRRIGRPPQGSASGDFVDTPGATTILGAGKLTGRTSRGWSFGLLDAVTGREWARTFDAGLISRTEVEPSTNYFVGRVSREGQRGGIGSLATATNRQLRTDDLRRRLSRQAYVLAGDAYVYLDGRQDWVLSGEAATSWLDGDSRSILRQQQSSRRYYQRPDASHVRLDPAATSLAGWRSRLEVERRSGAVRVGGEASATSPGFESNDAGFQSRADNIAASVNVSWTGYNPNRFTRERSIELEQSSRWNFAGDRQRDSWTISGWATFLNYWGLGGSFSFDRRTFDDRLTRGGPMAVAPHRREVSMEFESDSRKKLSFSVESSQGWDHEGGWESASEVSIKFKPSPTVNFSTGPSVVRSRSVAQHVTAITDRLATNTFGSRYVFADIDQTEVSMTTRLNVVLTPRLSFEFYAEPFIAAGRYSGFKEFERPRTFEFLRYGDDVGTIALDTAGAEYLVDPDGQGPAQPFALENPDFNEKSLITKSVVRWEWRPGSTLYLVWTQAREDDTLTGDFSFGRDAGALLRAAADDVFLVKVSYWFGR